MTQDTATAKMDEQQLAFHRALRSPVERACRIASNALQAFLAAVGSLIPEFGWVPAAT